MVGPSERWAPPGVFAPPAINPDMWKELKMLSTPCLTMMNVVHKRKCTLSKTYIDVKKMERQNALFYTC